MNRGTLTVTKALIIICVVVHLVGMFRQVPVAPNYSVPIFFELGAFSWFKCMEEMELWRIISYQFVHADVMHLVFNMWALFFFGPAIEHIMGPRRFLAFYLTCGVAGALFSALLGCTILYTPYWAFIPMVGASAAIYGVMIATAFLYPHARISLLFPPVTLTMRAFALIIIGIATAVILFNGNNAGGEAGHLGGIIMGLIIMFIWKWRTRSRYY
ncbi:MAG: rhomboid family intramembrane serine protease [Akkermansia sp.]|nr:rhomboid family intramembrane serine protease [Akkermansia sp.]